MPRHYADFNRDFEEVYLIKMLRRKGSNHRLSVYSVRAMTLFLDACWKDDMRQKCAKHLLIEKILKKNILRTKKIGTKFAYNRSCVCVGVKERIFLASPSLSKKGPVSTGPFYFMRINFQFNF